jgi:glycerol-3-phosphate dehydrogenase (NAD(P)+)
MKRIAIALGAQEKTLDGLCGVGDLIATCTTKLSRNYSAGVLIGSGKGLVESLEEIHMVVEGVKTCKSAYNLSKDMNLKTPIIDSMYHILFDNTNPTEELNSLMSRRLIDENE